MDMPLLGSIFRSTAPLVFMATVTGTWLVLRLPFPVSGKIEGAIGVLVGLFVSSYPSARFLTALLFGTPERIRPGKRKGLVLWLVLNALVLVSGWLVIVIATTRFVETSG